MSTPFDIGWKIVQDDLGYHAYLHITNAMSRSASSPTGNGERFVYLRNTDLTVLLDAVAAVDPTNPRTWGSTSY